jgi:hypothetical protein
LYDDALYYKFFEETLGIDRIDQIINQQRFFQKIGYGLVPIALLLRVFFTSICLAMGAFFSKQHLTFSQYFNIVIKADIIFLFELMMKISYFSIFGVNSLQELNGRLFSILQYIGYDNVEQWLSYRFLYPDNENTQTFALERTYPLPDWFALFRHRSVGGLFEGANQEDFSDAELLYTTVDSLDMRWHTVSINNPQLFQYLRYYSAPDGHCNMAEIHFLSSGKELTGEVIGTEGQTDKIKKRSKNAAFDGDPESYFDSPSPDGAWTGLKLAKLERITQIEFLFRTDDNSIREGDVYELFFFSEKGTISLGKQTGTKNGVLYYHNAPPNALYWLHNETRGREERIFTYENRKQVWW